jgi:hypothetical protein
MDISLLLLELMTVLLLASGFGLVQLPWWLAKLLRRGSNR